MLRQSTKSWPARPVVEHGFVLDFVGIFDKLEKALAFDSDEINAIVKDIGLLKQLFKAKMESKVPPYLALVTRKFDDKDVDNLIEHFRDKGRREEFFKEYKEVEMLYEIISPDAFGAPRVDSYPNARSRPTGSRTPPPTARPTTSPGGAFLRQSGRLTYASGRRSQTREATR